MNTEKVCKNCDKFVWELNDDGLCEECCNRLEGDWEDD